MVYVYKTIISASLFPGGRRGVWFRRLYDVLRKHNRDRDEDSLSDKGMICYYVDRAWQLYSFLARFSCKDTTFFAYVQFFLHICSKNDDLWLYPQAFEHGVYTAFLLVEVGMDVEIEGCGDVGVPEEDADGFAVTA